MDPNERIKEECRATWWDNARAHAINDAEEVGLRGAERETFIQERTKSYYAQLEKLSDVEDGR
jgi:hypothetical protein